MALERRWSVNPPPILTDCSLEKCSLLHRRTAVLLRWMCSLLARLSNERWHDAFRAAGYDTKLEAIAKPGVYESGSFNIRCIGIADGGTRVSPS